MHIELQGTNANIQSRSSEGGSVDRRSFRRGVPSVHPVLLFRMVQIKEKDLREIAQVRKKRTIEKTDPLW